MLIESIILTGVLGCSSVEKHKENCVYETYTFSSSSGDFCVETRETCFFDGYISDFYYIACYPNKIFVGNFE